MKSKIILTIILMFTLLVPTISEAKSFSGSSSRSSYSSSRSSSYSSSRPRTTSSYSKSSTSRTTTKPKVSLTKTPTTKSTTNKSFSGNTSTKSKSATTTKKGSFSGATSTKTTTKSGTFSGKTSTVKGRTYTTRTSTRSYYNGHYVSVNHYYHVGYSPYGWFGYYHGFSVGMFWGSMIHPWGHVYPVGGQYVSYGASPIAWIMDILALIILAGIVIAVIRAVRPSKKVYSRRF